MTDFMDACLIYEFFYGCFKNKKISMYSDRGLDNSILVWQYDTRVILFV